MSENTISLGHIAITVKDMDASVLFYTEALGLKKAFEIAHPETGAPWIVYLNVREGEFIELFYGGEEKNPWQSKRAGVQHLCLCVSDIHAAVKKVLDAGFSMDVMPNEGCDTNWQAWTKDPDGVRIELMSIAPTSPHAKYM